MSAQPQLRQSLTVPQPLVRISNWITIALIALAWLLSFPLLLLVPTLYFASGAFLGKNPIMVIGKRWLDSSKSYIMEDKEKLSFNSLLAFIMLVFALVSFYAGLPSVYYVLSALCLVANFGAALGYCIGCFIRFQWQQFRYRRSQ